MQQWMRLWLNDETRLMAAKIFQFARIDWVLSAWGASGDLIKRDIFVPNALVDNYLARIDPASKTSEFMLSDALCVNGVD